MDQKQDTKKRNALWLYLDKMTFEQRHRFAKRAKTTMGYLRHPASGRKKIGPELALELEFASDGVLRAEELCPEFDWASAAHGRCARCAANLAAVKANTTTLKGDV